jgi:hypothetical protein
MAIGCVTNSSPIMERRTLNKTISTFIAAAAALALSGSAFAQNNTLATPSVVSPAAAAVNATTNGYGTPGATGSDSGTSAGSSNSGAPKSANTGAAANTTAYGVNNTLARPSTTSPAQ